MNTPVIQWKAITSLSSWEASHKAHSIGQQFSCPYFKPCKKHSIRYVVMGRVMQCSQTRLERSPLPGVSGLAGLRRMPPGPQSATGQQWHHPAAGNRNRKSLKHGNAQLTQETTTLCWRGWILKFIYAALGTYGKWFNKSKNGILANPHIPLVSFNIPNRSRLQKTWEVILQKLNSLLRCLRLLPICLMFPFTTQLLVKGFQNYDLFATIKAIHSLLRRRAAQQTKSSSVSSLHRCLPTTDLEGWSWDVARAVKSKSLVYL